jgi:tagaturonate reductase
LPAHEHGPSGLARIGPDHLPPDIAEEYRKLAASPPKVLQFGEGNFLRGFADWMLHVCNRKGLWNGSVVVTQPRPTGRANLEQLRKQQGIYTLLLRGLHEGRRVETKETISVFSQMIDPYAEWDRFLALAENPSLEFVISNTTEAGLVYQPSEWRPDAPVLSFPGKLAMFLYRRYRHFQGDPSRGLIHLPCELLDRNGDRLLEAVLLHAEDWGLPIAFRRWVRESNRFLNTLVDRIVTGYPAEEASDLFAEWGYADPLVTTAEPYHFWAIQGEPELEKRLPLATAGLNVKWVEDLAPYQMRKVRILNGTHTMMATIGLVNGLHEVREALEHPVWGPRFMQGLFDEIVPGLQMDRQPLTEYANEMLERFRNPYIKHKLADIAMNSLSKWKVRLLPSLKAHLQRTGQIPPVLAESLATLLRLYRHTAGDEAHSVLPDGSRFPLRDDPASLEAIRNAWESVNGGEPDDVRLVITRILSNADLWGENLLGLTGLADETIRLYLRREEAR